MTDKLNPVKELEASAREMAAMLYSQAEPVDSTQCARIKEIYSRGFEALEPLENADIYSMWETDSKALHDICDLIGRAIAGQDLSSEALRLVQWVLIRVEEIRRYAMPAGEDFGNGTIDKIAREILRKE